MKIYSTSGLFQEFVQLAVLLLLSLDSCGVCSYLNNGFKGKGDGSLPSTPKMIPIYGLAGGGGGRQSFPWEPSSGGPMFDPSAPRNVTALKDDNAYLHCIVYNIGNKTVSWIRLADLHILTVNQYTYTADDRFEVIHDSPDTNNGYHSWTLKIKSVQPRDSGQYECQVNTHPTDPITFHVYLSVFVPTATILGSKELFVDRGSTINLTCVINHNPESPTEIFWYHDDEVISYDNRDSRVSVITDRGPITKTILLIHDAHDAATGTYSCVPSPVASASVRIHILNGEHPAAMQTNMASSLFSSCILPWLWVDMLLFLSAISSEIQLFICPSMYR